MLIIDQFKFAFFLLQFHLINTEKPFYTNSSILKQNLVLILGTAKCLNNKPEANEKLNN